MILILSAYLTTAYHLRNEPKVLSAVLDTGPSNSLDRLEDSKHIKTRNTYRRLDVRQYRNTSLSTSPQLSKLSRRGSSDRSRAVSTPKADSEQSPKQDRGSPQQARPQLQAKMPASLLSEKKVALNRVPAGSPSDLGHSPRIKSIPQVKAGTSRKSSSSEASKSPGKPFDLWSDLKPFVFSSKSGIKQIQNHEVKDTPVLKVNIETRRSSKANEAQAVARADRSRKRRDERSRSRQESSTRSSSRTPKSPQFPGMVGIPPNLAKIKVTGDKTGGLYEKLELENWDGRDFEGPMLHPSGSKYDDSP